MNVPGIGTTGQSDRVFVQSGITATSSQQGGGAWRRALSNQAGVHDVRPPEGRQTHSTRGE